MGARDEVLADELQRSRFYGSKSQPVDSAVVEASAPLADAARLAVVRAAHGGTSDRYQMVLDSAGHDVLAAHADELGGLLAAGEYPGGAVVHGDASCLAGLTGAALGQEQSNSTLVYRDADGRPKVAVKFFRRLSAGVNPEIELLSGIKDCPFVPRLFAWVGARIDGEEHALVTVQEFIADSRDGWLDALDHAARGTSFTEPAFQLGRATRAVHDALADAFGTAAMPAAQSRQRLEARLDSLVAQNPRLGAVAGQARRRYARLTGEGRSQRVHGDLHLGQVLRTPVGFRLLDFEGEPARPLAERRLPDSPVRDVAGLVRSIDYAAHFPAYTAAADASGAAAGPQDPRAWSAEASAALLAGYGLRADQRELLDAYVLDKALYEVVYETENRPDWVGIPRAAVRRLLPD